MLDMPIDPADSANAAFGIWPFGVHGGDHALDGHPGWDIEFRPGALLRAPADGTVGNIQRDARNTITMSIDHVNGRLRTDYTNLASLADGIVGGATVRRGQVLGVPATISAFIGPRSVTFAMAHFQYDDFTHNEGMTNPFAVNPDTVLSVSGRALFETIWRTAAYTAELVEPFVGNARDVTFPLTRTWLRESGSLAVRIDLTRSSPNSTDYQYVMRDGAGGVVEQGTAGVDAGARPFATIEFRPASGGTRQGVWDVFNDRMQMDYAAPGGQRPAGLGGASTYRTTR